MDDLNFMYYAEDADEDDLAQIKLIEEQTAKEAQNGAAADPGPMSHIPDQ